MIRLYLVCNVFGQCYWSRIGYIIWPGAFLVILGWKNRSDLFFQNSESGPLSKVSVCAILGIWYKGFWNPRIWPKTQESEWNPWILCAMVQALIEAWPLSLQSQLGHWSQLTQWPSIATKLMAGSAIELYKLNGQLGHWVAQSQLPACLLSCTNWVAGLATKFLHMVCNTPLGSLSSPAWHSQVILEKLPRQF
jgi:hypothetical protein